MSHPFVCTASHIPMVWDFSESVPIRNQSGGNHRHDGAASRRAESAWLLIGRLELRLRIGATFGIHLPSRVCLWPLYHRSSLLQNAVPYGWTCQIFSTCGFKAHSACSTSRRLFDLPLAPKGPTRSVKWLDGIRFVTHTRMRLGFEERMAQAMKEGGPGTRQPRVWSGYNLRHKSTAGWEALLQAMIKRRLEP